MVFERREEPGEPQIHRHAVSHQPTGMDPVFPVNSATGDPSNGTIITYINGVWTTETITNVFNNSSTAASGAKVVYIPFGSQMANGITYAP